MSVSERLRVKLEDDFGIIIPSPLQRIYGVKGAAFRWHCKDSNGDTYQGEDSMSDCLKVKRLNRILDIKAIGIVYNVG